MLEASKKADMYIDSIIHVHTEAILAVVAIVVLHYKSRLPHSLVVRQMRL